GHIVLGMELTKVFCLYDEGVKKAGIAGDIVSTLKAAGLDVVEWDGVVSNPTDVVVEEGARLAREAESQVVVAVGGGSVMDAGKAVCILLANESPIDQYDGINMVKIATPPLVAIPTTAGSASEVTSFAVITDTVKLKKMVIGGQYVGAKYALIDPLLTKAMPPALTATTGMDALTHAIEAYLSRGASIPTDVNALKAVELISGNLIKAVEKGTDLGARTNMLIGSMLAGFAFNSAVLGLAHSIAHPLSVHCGLPHGVANAAVLPYVVEFNAEAAPARVRDIGKAMGLNIGELPEKQALQETVAAIRTLSGKIGIPTLKEVGVSRDLFDRIASDALQEISTIFNPRDTNKEDVLRILEKAY
ncbi:MAG TPA: iron-containing alcohol dehydrogenase, partial [Geobacteraceae bacterium]|nr:iron-containing alcohol dehydrogenase [Geobacteraceae bacterium]